MGTHSVLELVLGNICIESVEIYSLLRYLSAFVHFRCHPLPSLRTSVTTVRIEFVLAIY